ncbi:MAG: hypothetical protein VR72_14425 [Clostridiaceae bacterium BRH_c20a]|nr:MAG: hypothetical protein VR72_14425 [Clostridiaceae bacterium BRH_c20a]
MYVGARILKTGIAVALSMYICILFNIQPAIFAGAATVVNLQQSVGRSFRDAYEQVIVHFISVSIAIFLGLTITFQPLSMGLATIIIITFCTKILKWYTSISMGVVAAIFILGAPANEFLQHALVRSLAIFIGLGVALAINALIAPPHYQKVLISKLIELNLLASQFFTDAVNCFLNLEIQPELMDSNKMAYKKVLDEAEKYYELYSHERALEIVNINSQKQFYNEYIHYNKGLWQRSKDILFLADERKERRKNAQEPPISSEFKEILDLLMDAVQITSLSNIQLQKKVKGEKTDFFPEPHIWSKLEIIINQWHHRFPSGNYYLHALIEIALVTYKIRWSAKESTRLLSLNVDEIK